SGQRRIVCHGRPSFPGGTGTRSILHLGTDTDAGPVGDNEPMLVVHVDVSVVPDSVPAFLDASRANAAASLGEPGVIRFDVVQDRADPTHVVLVEVYRDDEAAAAHK